MPSYSYKCQVCEVVVTELRAIKDRDDLLDLHCVCEASDWVRLMAAPIVLRASYHDGKDRGESWNNLTKASKLEKEAAGMDPKKRGDIKKEIKKLKKL